MLWCYIVFSRVGLVLAFVAGVSSFSFDHQTNSYSRLSLIRRSSTFTRKNAFITPVPNRRRFNNIDSTAYRLPDFVLAVSISGELSALNNNRDISSSKNQTENTVEVSRVHSTLQMVAESVDSSTLSLSESTETNHNIRSIRDMSIKDDQREYEEIKNMTFFTNAPQVITMPLPSSPLEITNRSPIGSNVVETILTSVLGTFRSPGVSAKLDGEIFNNDGAASNNEILTLDYSDATIKKVFNAVLLLASFVGVAYAIFSIDATITRGWTQSEIAMRLPVDTWSSYEASLQDNPVYTKTLINVIIYLLGDWLSQTLFQKKSILEFDATRTIRNGFIGLCFGPLVHEYYQFSDHILPVEGGMMNRIQKIIMDQTIYLSVKCSIYIVAIGLLQGDSWDTSITNVKNKIGPICFTAWKFWPLVHLITYNVIPARHRILWVNCVDLIWNAILASKTSSPILPTPDNDDNQLASTIAGTAKNDDEIMHAIVSIETEVSDNTYINLMSIHNKTCPEMTLQTKD